MRRNDFWPCPRFFYFSLIFRHSLLNFPFFNFQTQGPVCKCDEISQNFLWLNRFNSGFTSSLVYRGIESKILVTWWGRAGLNNASLPEWVWRTLKLTVKRFKGLSYLCFKRLSRTEFYDYYIVPNYTLPLLAQYASPVYLSNQLL